MQNPGGYANGVGREQKGVLRHTLVKYAIVVPPSAEMESGPARDYSFDLDHRYQARHRLRC